MKKMKFFKNNQLLDVFNLIDQEPQLEGFWIFSLQNPNGGLYLSDIDLIEKQQDQGFLIFKNNNIYKIEFLN